jgi:ABC-type multidrug transport system ATPase subunit
MKQRIGIAQVLVGDPKLLILDEPTVGLDPEERVRFRNLLTDLSGDRVVILSSHIVSDIETIAGDIAIVFEGRALKSNFRRGNGTLEEEYLRVIASAKNGGSHAA